jgi:hypothetical protein
MIRLNFTLLVVLMLINPCCGYSQEFNWVNITGEDGVSVGTDISINSNGDTYSTGVFSGIMDVDPSTETFYIGSSSESFEVNSQYLQKLNSSGELIWVDSFDLINRIILSFEIDDNENILVIGAFRGEIDFDPSANEFILESSSSSSGHQQWNIYIQKLDPSGNLIWAKSLIGSAGNGLSSTRLAKDNDNNISITGKISNTNTIDFDPGPDVFEIPEDGNFLLKLNSNGDFVWARMIEPPITSFTFDNDNNIILVGSFFYSIDFDPGSEEEIRTATDITTDIFILKLNEFGDFIWVNTYPSQGIDRGNNVAIDNLNNIIVTGNFRQTIDFDTSSEIFELSSEDGFPDVYILKLNEMGDFIYVKQIGGVGNQIDRDMSLDYMNNLYLTGDFTGTTDFNPNSEVHNLTSAGYQDIFVIKLNTNGIFDWAIPIHSENSNESKSIAISESMEEIYLTGYIKGITDFDPTEAEELYNTINDNDLSGDIFVLKLEQESLDIDEFESGIVKIFPNPVENRFTIYVENIGSLELYDSLGRLVKTIKIYPSNNTISIEGLKNGIYFARVKTEKGTEVIKLIKGK